MFKIGIRFILLNIICFVSLYFLVSCTWKKEDISQKIVLKADFTSMTAEEFSKSLAERLSIYDALSAKDISQINRVKSEIERDFVIRAIVENWSKRENISVDKKEIDQELNKIRDSFSNDLSLRQELSHQGISFNDWQKKMAYGTLEKKVFKKITSQLPEPTEAEIGKFYEANKAKYVHKEKIFLRQIVLATEASADTIQEALKTNKPFEKLASSFSVTPEAKNGGLVGWIERGTLEVFDKAFDLPLNTISTTFASPYGFHIFRVENKLPAGHQTLNEVKASIVRTLKGQLEQALFKSWLDKEIRQVHVYKDHKLIQAMTVETRGK